MGQQASLMLHTVFHAYYAVPQAQMQGPHACQCTNCASSPHTATRVEPYWQSRLEGNVSRIPTRITGKTGAALGRSLVARAPCMWHHLSNSSYRSSARCIQPLHPSPRDSTLRLTVTPCPRHARHARKRSTQQVDLANYVQRRHAGVTRTRLHARSINKHGPCTKEKKEESWSACVAAT